MLRKNLKWSKIALLIWFLKHSHFVSKRKYHLSEQLRSEFLAFAEKNSKFWTQKLWSNFWKIYTRFYLKNLLREQVWSRITLVMWRKLKKTAKESIINGIYNKNFICLHCFENQWNVKKSDSRKIWNGEKCTALFSPSKR